MATIGVKEITLESVKKIAKLQGISNGEFVELAADFFNKTGIDLKEGYSIKAELKEQNKRLNSVIAWTTKNEKEFIYPVFTEVVKNNKLTEEYLKRLSPEIFKKAFQDMKEAMLRLEKLVELSNQSKLSLEKQLQLESKKNIILVNLVSLERDFKGTIKDKQLESELRTKLNELTHVR